ncbi:MAG TPA: tRNA pseudouridine(55) synthase TruB [Pyrinomonadaceae bacterium]|nr:tRNA pseudouridine(55) synthase TruB [Pyrinomonadaceae bacterium]
MDGVLLIDKPPGLTSHDVVAQVRHILHVRRVGHTGTLDPFATGVLVVLVGKATRLAQFLSGLEKEYEAVIRLGYATDTGDLTGQKLSAESGSPNAPGPWDKDQIEAALESLRGEIDQVPPMYSAKKQGGRKLYELARQGQEVERQPVRVCIYKFEALKPSAELLKDNLDGTFDFEVRVSCSAGTYVRTLAEDFGKRLNTGAHLVELRRTRVGDLSVDQAQTLTQLKEAFAEESLGTILYRPDDLLVRLPFLDLNDDEVPRVRNGMDIQVEGHEWNDGERIRKRDQTLNLIAVGVFAAAKKSLHPAVVIVSEEL